jgi:hypothetical protein
MMKPGSLWPWIVGGALALHVVGSMVMVYIATSNDSYAVEPDYYAKALAWDERRAQEQTNAELGWTLDFVVEPAAAGADPVLRVDLTDASGQPLSDATISVETFSNLHRGDVVTATLRATDAGFEAMMPMRGAGRWEFRFSAQRGDDLFTHRDTRHIWTHLESDG